MEVHKVLGCGFTEPIYQEALELEFQLRDIPYEREKTFHVHYKGQLLEKDFRADFVCFDEIIVELKAIVNDKMVNALPLSVPVVVEMNTGANWLEAH